MCILCDAGKPQNHSASRRNFLKGAAATGVAAAGLNLFASRPAAADADDAPEGSGRPARPYVIRAGPGLPLNPKVVRFPEPTGPFNSKQNLPLRPHLLKG